MNKPCFNPFPILESERIILRQLKLEDAQSIFNYQSNKENFPYVDMPIYKELDEAASYIDRMNKGVSSDSWIIWGITNKDTDEILGTISIWNISIDESSAELGYGLFPGNQGKGIMSEALNEVVKYGFNIMGLKVIEAYTNKLNDSSIRLLENNSFIYKETIKEESMLGNTVEMAVYSINK